MNGTTKMSGTLNKELVRALDKHDHRQLATSAHEIGHALGELNSGVRPEWVRLNFGFFLGFTGGYCKYGTQPDRDSPRERKLGYLVSTIAGHAAETRFCQLYLGLTEKAAFKFGREWADGDYEDFRYWRSTLGLGWSISPEWAFDRATAVLQRAADRLDRLTLRLVRDRYIPGSRL
jgi:hypothetical protein